MSWSGSRGQAAGSGGWQGSQGFAAFAATRAKQSVDVYVMCCPPTFNSGSGSSGHKKRGAEGRRVTCPSRVLTYGIHTNKRMLSRGSLVAQSCLSLIYNNIIAYFRVPYDNIVAYPYARKNLNFPGIHKTKWFLILAVSSRIKFSKQTHKWICRIRAQLIFIFRPTATTAKPALAIVF